MSKLVFLISIVIGFSIFYSFGLYLDRCWKKKKLKNGAVQTSKEESYLVSCLVCIYFFIASLISGILLHYDFIR